MTSKNNIDVRVLDRPDARRAYPHGQRNPQAFGAGDHERRAACDTYLQRQHVCLSSTIQLDWSCSTHPPMSLRVRRCFDVSSVNWIASMRTRCLVRVASETAGIVAEAFSAEQIPLVQRFHCTMCRACKLCVYSLTPKCRRLSPNKASKPRRRPAPISYLLKLPIERGARSTP